MKEELPAFEMAQGGDPEDSWTCDLFMGAGTGRVESGRSSASAAAAIALAKQDKVARATKVAGEIVKPDLYLERGYDLERISA